MTLEKAGIKVTQSMTQPSKQSNQQHAVSTSSGPMYPDGYLTKYKGGDHVIEKFIELEMEDLIPAERFAQRWLPLLQRNAHEHLDLFVPQELANETVRVLAEAGYANRVTVFGWYQEQSGKLHTPCVSGK